jgi:hypothetical protein
MQPKQLYIPGMFSLLFIFPVYYYVTKPYTNYQYVITHFVPSDRTDTGISYGFTVAVVLDAIKHKEQIRFWLDGDKFLNKKKLQMIQEESLKQKFTYDTSRLISVVLNEQSTYSDFVALLNMCLINDVKRYVWVRDTFYILAEPPPLAEDDSLANYVCGTSFYTSYHKEQPSGLSTFGIALEKYFFPYWYWWLPFGFLLMMAFVRFRRIHKIS